MWLKPFSNTLAVGETTNSQHPVHCGKCVWRGTIITTTTLLYEGKFGMKKLLVILMALCLLMTCVACGKKANDNNSNNSTTESQTTVSNENVTANSSKITVEQLNNADTAKETDFIFMESKDGTYKISEYKGSAKLLKIPNEYQGKPVGSPEGYFFANDYPISAIKFSDNMIELDEFVCALNENLQVVVFGSNTKVIGESAFQGCSSLYEVVLNDGLETISLFSFAQCNSLKSITIPSSVKSIDATAFYGCPKDFVIYGESGSFAESYAQTNGIQFEAK